MVFLLWFTTAWLNGSFTYLAVRVTGIEQKEKRVLSCAARSCEAVVLNGLSAPPGPARSLRLSCNVEVPSVKGAGVHLEGSHMDSSGTSGEREEIPSSQAWTNTNDLTIPAREKC